MAVQSAEKNTNKEAKMKKGAALFALLLAGGVCFAQNISDYNRVNQLLRKGLGSSNLAAVEEGAVNLDEAERLRLYNNHRIRDDKMWAGAALNFFLGFGIGNFYQRDYLGGGVTLGGDIVGAALIITGVVKIAKIYAAGLTGGYTGISDEYDAVAYYSVGSIICAGANLFGLVRTFVFPAGYNNRLRNALQVQGLVMNIEPSIHITGQGVELALVNLKF
jgi:hypothetical protein